MPLPRDPRKDPQPGDVLATPWRTRRVLKVLPGVWSPVIRYSTPNGAKPGKCTIENWRRWSRHADVVRHADDKTPTSSETP